MEKVSYSNKLKNPKWQKRRLEIMQRDNFECKCCLSTTTELNVHHFNYSKEPWESEDFELITICNNCHGIYHKIFDNFDKAIIANLSDLYWNYIKESNKKIKLYGRLDKTTQKVT